MQDRQQPGQELLANPPGGSSREGGHTFPLEDFDVITCSRLIRMVKQFRAVVRNSSWFQPRPLRAHECSAAPIYPYTEEPL